MTDPIIIDFDDPPPPAPMTGEEFERLYALLSPDFQQVVAALVRRLAKDGGQQ
jgi:hypothetical protein